MVYLEIVRGEANVTDPHRCAYEKLLDVTRRLSIAIEQDTSEKLEELANEHRAIMAQLRQLGLSNDPGLLELVQQASNRTGELMHLMCASQEQLAGFLAAVTQKRKQALAYHRVGSLD
ncbi:hypothetical protein [Desulfoferrobacter suflitae]|uniref:hypothetical protein n=1 Tax=Desulfoferrobacter suflitae TaxID=2865782 RepID=UPI0021647E6D|nr:hypothetical protein [Desulfoferrobacter suflitae]MCK8602388.1 hypothetical protein [Desulfoferrobacter suflitae]